MKAFDYIVNSSEKGLWILNEAGYPVTPVQMAYPVERFINGNIGVTIIYGKKKVDGRYPLIVEDFHVLDSDGIYFSEMLEDIPGLVLRDGVYEYAGRKYAATMAAEEYA